MYVCVCVCVCVCVLLLYVCVCVLVNEVDIPSTDYCQTHLSRIEQDTVLISRVGERVGFCCRVNTHKVLTHVLVVLAHEIPIVCCAVAKTSRAVDTAWQEEGVGVVGVGLTHGTRCFFVLQAVEGHDVAKAVGRQRCECKRGYKRGMVKKRCVCVCVCVCVYDINNNRHTSLLLPEQTHTPTSYSQR